MVYSTPSPASTGYTLSTQKEAVVWWTSEPPSKMKMPSVNVSDNGKQETGRAGTEPRLYGIYYQQIAEMTDMIKTCKWLARVRLKDNRESLTMAAQEQTLSQDVRYLARSLMPPPVFLLLNVSENLLWFFFLDLFIIVPSRCHISNWWFLKSVKLDQSELCGVVFVFFIIYQFWYPCDLVVTCSSINFLQKK